MNWSEILFGTEDASFMLDVIIRTFLMIIIIILALRVLGKRGVKQLSIFELVVIISFGTAAGDPMIYKEVGIVTAVVSFVVVIIVYKILIYLMGKFSKLEKLMEDEPICVIENGKFCMQNFKKENLGSYELFSVLRMNGVSQLGQVQYAIEEISGELSVFFLEDQQVQYGLPILPQELERKVTEFKKETYYSCLLCGHTVFNVNHMNGSCEVCDSTEWLEATNRKRVH